MTTTVDEAEASVASSESDVVPPVAALTSLSIASDAVSTSAAFSVVAVSGSALLSDFVDDDDFAEVVSVVSGLLNTSPTASTATGAKNPTANKITYPTAITDQNCKRVGRLGSISLYPYPFYLLIAYHYYTILKTSIPT